MDISSFKTGGESVLEFSGLLEDNKTDYDTDGLDLVYPVLYQGRLLKFGDDMELVLKVKYTLRTNCDRCLKEMEMGVSYDTEFYIPSSEGRHIYEEDNSDEILFLEDNELPLEDLVMSLVITSIPTKALCDEDCKGLCPKCGKNLNEGSCNCELEVTDERFDVLKNLFNENKEV